MNVSVVMAVQEKCFADYTSRLTVKIMIKSSYVHYTAVQIARIWNWIQNI